MNFFGRNRSGLAEIKAKHASGAQQAPTKMSPCVVHPENAPRTILNDDAYPQNFARYEYAGASLELVKAGQNADGSPLHRPAMVAKMIGKTEIGGAKFTEEMTASVEDLRAYRDPQTGKAGHPQAETVAAALAKDYKTKVPPTQQEAARQKNTLAQAPAPKQGGLAQQGAADKNGASFGKAGSNSLFNRLNKPGSGF